MRHPIAARVVYHDACHLAHAQQIRSQPRALLASIPGVELLTPAESDICCGSAGIYNLVEPGTSDAVLAPKLRHVEATGASLVATGNPGCLMQLGAGLRRSGSSARVLHPVDLLDAAYAETVV